MPRPEPWRFPALVCRASLLLVALRSRLHHLPPDMSVFLDAAGRGVRPKEATCGALSRHYALADAPALRRRLLSCRRAGWVRAVDRFESLIDESGGALIHV